MSSPLKVLAPPGLFFDIMLLKFIATKPSAKYNKKKFIDRLILA